QAPVDSADFDGDDDVDGADFLTWQRGLGGPATPANGNATNDGAVDGADLAVWAIQFGGSTVEPAPDAPTSLAAAAISSSQIDLTWNDVATNETGYEVDRATNNTFTTGLFTTNIAANSASYSATGLAASTTYYFRVRATNAVGDSADSNTDSATTTPIAGSTFYISLTGSDANNGTTAGAAWATLDKALRTAPANSTVLLQSGTYSATQTTLTDPGRTGLVTFKPATAGGVTLGGLIDWKKVTDVRLEGFNFTNFMQVRETENFQFVNNDVTNAGIAVYGADGALVEGNNFHSYTAGYAAILFRSYNIFLISGSNPRDFRADNVVIRNNTVDVSNQPGDAIHVESGTNVLIEKNTIRNVQTTGAAHGDSIQLVEVDSSTITGNIMSTGRGIIVHHFLTSTGANISPYIPGVNHDLTFTNNVHTSGNDFSLRLHESPNSIIVNNTFWATGTTAGHSLDIGRNSTNIVLANNIVRVMRVDATVTYAVRGNNLIGTIFGTTRVATEIGGTPSFVNYAAGDLRLTTTSLGLNAGLTGSFVPALDYEGLVRDTTPNMGAYELNG
ncbi:MAG: right-handed parallel beta-helix repeat-containing protein, partial [Pirellulales bacterium]|nr:right-handed parallel beta-helix repeat-containing protein [Pirellulales bacterium]